MRLSKRRRSLALALAAALACAGVALAVVLLGDGDEPADGPPPATIGSAGDDGSGTSPPGTTGGGDADDAGDTGAGRPAQPPPAPGGEPTDAGSNPDARLAKRVVRRYVGGLTARDGEQVCGLLAPGAIEQVELPRPGGDCAAALTASIGYRDPRGFPQFERAQLKGIREVELSDDGARVTATVVTDFADRSRPSIEEDVIYLERTAADFVVAQPSAVLYRAIGAAEVPPQALAPPE